MPLSEQTCLLYVLSLHRCMLNKAVGMGWAGVEVDCAELPYGVIVGGSK